MRSEHIQISGMLQKQYLWGIYGTKYPYQKKDSTISSQ